jgi:SAM-dependent methyltransferase
LTTVAPDSPADGYELIYRAFDVPLMRRFRSEAYGEDIGQHSWVRAGELRADIRSLELSAASRLLDLGCGAGGPLAFVLAAAGCRGTGVERSAAALGAARARAESLGVAHLLTVQQSDLDAPLPFASGSFDVAIALDVVCHVRDRALLFGEVARVLSPGGFLLFTDPCIVTGSVSSEEVRRRSVHGHTRFAAPGWNEAALHAAGFHLLATEDRTASVLANARGRLGALQAHRAELEQVLGAARTEREQDYLGAVIDLAERGALSRVMYLAATGLPCGVTQPPGGP